MTWRLLWEHTAMLIQEARASCDYDVAEISRGGAEQIVSAENLVHVMRPGGIR
jgi:hypothetical protein